MLPARAAILLFAAIPDASAEWVRIATPQIEILTDAGEKQGRQVLERFEQIGSMFRESATTGSQPGLRVFLFSSDREFRRYIEGAATDGFYQSGQERDYIVLHTVAGLPRVVVHETMHRVLNHGSGPLPKWFDEGTAEFYSNLDFQRRGTLLVGSAIPEHVSILSSSRTWLSAEELVAATARSGFYDERSRAGIFYAESWALVHMLNLAPGYRDHMPRFAELVSSGAGPARAFQEAFGRTLDQALRDLEKYIGRMRPATVQAPPPAAAMEVRVQRLSPMDATLARGDLALHCDRLELARDFYQQAARDNPASSAAEAGLGSLAMAENRKDDARRHLQRALDLGGDEAGTWFEFAMLEREAGAPPERVDELLRKAVAMNSGFAEAHFLLGVRATDSGQYADAIAHLREAVRVLPRQSYFWHALGYAQWRGGRSEEAAESARRAVAAAQTAEQDAMAHTLLESLR